MTLEAQLRDAYRGRRVLVTGHTGFKGSWLTLWLSELGADVTGLALAPDTNPALFDVLGLKDRCRHIVGDVRDGATVKRALAESGAEIVLHLAAQPLVRLSYEKPLETLETNVMGTAQVLDAVRAEGTPRTVVVVTSDKCYENREWIYGYREDEAMGGHDVYSMSKGATELVVSSWRRSFFHPEKLAQHGIAVASGRAGNVIGGGDWALDRLIPDLVRHLAEGRRVPIRRPDSVRPWQHVLEPLSGYLLLGARLRGVGLERAQVSDFCDGWNFGPQLDGNHTVRNVADALVRTWGSGGWDDKSDPNAPHEAGLLRLSIEKATTRLGWSPRWGFTDTIQKTAEWYRAFYEGASHDSLVAMTLRQIREYVDGTTRAG